ncbi:hypothetical protein F384_12700 [Citrobacter amalonaticus Y19]|uniref:Alpha-1,4 glucan phosphorylase n=1 Tax=Citrobacter amalonaticus Y19 TaxID=1261127 RepID=A0A059VE10_CITAM|nr:hypothetical protein F384_12700 [Citrobacter amalonaticus Y19]
MRLLIDEHKFSWEDAFEVCCQVFSYTNHTLMSEALETWSVDMLGKILPRHLQIIFEINDYFLKTLQEQYPNDTALLERASISYVDCQDKVDELYRHPEKWIAGAMLNIANMGYFSSDRTIKEYAENIWHIDSVRL